MRSVAEDLGINLHDYQRYAVNFIKKQKKCHLYLDMGAGKTLCTLSALYEMDIKTDTLVIAPVNIVKSTWIQESKKWNFPFKFVSLALDENGKSLTKKKREKILDYAIEKHKRRLRGEETEPEIFLLGDCNVVKTIQHCHPYFPFENIVIDEIQGFKSPTSKRFQAMTLVSEESDILIGLTGTPVPNGMMDIWSQIYLLDEGKRLGRNIYSFQNRYFYPAYKINKNVVKYNIKDNAEREIYDKVKDLVISIKNPNIKLPPLIVDTMELELTRNQKLLYNKMKDSLMDKSNPGIMQMKLLQMASGAAYIDDDDAESAKNVDREYIVIHDQKLKALDYIISNTDGNILVAYFFKSDRNMIHNHLLKNKKKHEIFNGDPSIVERWNKGLIPILLMNPLSARHGLNLQEGGSTLVWYTMPFSLEAYMQTNKRLYRQGQKNTTRIIQLVVKQSMDERILEILPMKERTQKGLLDAVSADEDIKTGKIEIKTEDDFVRELRKAMYSLKNME